MPGGSGKGFFSGTWADTFNVQSVPGSVSYTYATPPGKKILEVELRGGTGSANYALPAYTQFYTYDPENFTQPGYSDVAYFSDNFTVQEDGYLQSFPATTIVTETGYNRFYPATTLVQETGYSRTYSDNFQVGQEGYSRTFDDNFYVVQAGYSRYYNGDPVVQEFGYTRYFTDNYYNTQPVLGGSYAPVNAIQEQGYFRNANYVYFVLQPGYTRPANYQTATQEAGYSVSNAQQGVFPAGYYPYVGYVSSPLYFITQPGNTTSYNPNYTTAIQQPAATFNDDEQISLQQPSASFNPNWYTQQPGYNFFIPAQSAIQENGYIRQFSPNYTYSSVAAQPPYNRSYNPNVALQEEGYTRTFNDNFILAQEAYTRSFDPNYYTQQPAYNRTYDPNYSVQQAAYNRSFNPNYVLQQEAYSRVNATYNPQTITQPGYVDPVSTYYPARITLGSSGTSSSLTVTAVDGSTYTISAPGTNTPANAYVTTQPAAATAVYATLYMPTIVEADTVSLTLGASPRSNNSFTYRPFVNVKYDGDAP